MFTVKDFQQRLSTEHQEKEKQLDEWIEGVVLPGWKGDNSGYEIPDNFLSSEIKKMLVARGFRVSGYSGWGGSYVYISIPPQGK